MIEIRHAEIKDVEGMVDVNLKTWRTTYSSIVSEDYLLEREKERDNRIRRNKSEFDKNKAEGRKSFQSVVLDNGKVIGMAIYGKCREEDKYGLKNAGEIYAIYILKEYQKQGIGKQFVNYIIKDLISENYDKVVIWALKDNPAVKFYIKIGGDGRLIKHIDMGKQVLEEVGFVYDDINELLRITKVDKLNNIESKVKNDLE